MPIFMLLLIDIYRTAVDIVHIYSNVQYKFNMAGMDFKLGCSSVHTNTFFTYIVYITVVTVPQKVSWQGKLTVNVNLKF